MQSFPDEPANGVFQGLAEVCCCACPSRLNELPGDLLRYTFNRDYPLTYVVVFDFFPFNKPSKAYFGLVWLNLRHQPKWQLNR